MQTISNYASTTFQRENQLCVQLKMKITGKQLSSSLSHPTVQRRLCQVEISLLKVSNRIWVTICQRFGRKNSPLKESGCKKHFNSSSIISTFNCIFFLCKPVSIYFCSNDFCLSIKVYLFLFLAALNFFQSFPVYGVFFLTRILNSESWIAALLGGLLIVMTFLFAFILFLLTLILHGHAYMS